MKLPTQDRIGVDAPDLAGAAPSSLSGTRRVMLWAAIGMALAGSVVIVYLTHQRETADILEIVRQAAIEEGIDPRLAEAVVHAESGGNPRARSRAGALGLMQLMPATANEIANREVNELELLQPRLNARLGCRYLRYLLRVYEGDLLLSLMAYNAGMGNVRKWRAKAPGTEPRYVLDHHGFAETQAYVARIIEYLRARTTPAEG